MGKLTCIALVIAFTTYSRVLATRFPVFPDYTGPCPEGMCMPIQRCVKVPEPVKDYAFKIHDDRCPQQHEAQVCCQPGHQFEETMRILEDHIEQNDPDPLSFALVGTPKSPEKIEAKIFPKVELRVGSSESLDVESDAMSILGESIFGKAFTRDPDNVRYDDCIGVFIEKEYILTAPNCLLTEDGLERTVIVEGEFYDLHISGNSTKTAVKESGNPKIPKLGLLKLTKKEKYPAAVKYTLPRKSLPQVHGIVDLISINGCKNQDSMIISAYALEIRKELCDAYGYTNFQACFMILGYSQECHRVRVGSPIVSISEDSTVLGIVTNFLLRKNYPHIIVTGSYVYPAIDWINEQMEATFHI